MPSKNIPIFVINLDRRSDRLHHMQDMLDGMGLAWERVSALDAQTAQDAEISQEVDFENTLIRMGRGSQCCAITNFSIFRKMVEKNIDAALILQDDIELSSEIKPYLFDTKWIPNGIGLVQFEKYGSKTSTRLASVDLTNGTMPRAVRKLFSRTAGAGCYLITLDAAKHILERKPRLRFPIDHFLFSPNVSPIFKTVGVAITTPALATQRDEEFESDIAAERKRVKSNRAKLRRLFYEINKLPSQLFATLKGARWVPFYFER